MVINIAAGTKFPQLKLYLYTKKFFNHYKRGRLITRKDKNYVIEIRKKTVCILLSNSSNESDFNKIREYIEYMFKNHSILIDSNKSIDWLNNIKNVNIRRL